MFTIPRGFRAIQTLLSRMLLVENNILREGQYELLESARCQRAEHARVVVHIVWALETRQIRGVGVSTERCQRCGACDVARANLDAAANIPYGCRRGE
jgi:hypothetical protein